MRIPKQDNAETLFPTVVIHREYGDDELNHELVGLIKGLQSDYSIPNLVKSNSITTVKGYQPDVVLHKHFADNRVWKQFMKEIVDPCIQAYMIQHHQVAGWPLAGSTYELAASWAVVYPAGAYQAPHLHRDISCVFTYYPQVPLRPRPEGAIAFINPHVESTFPGGKNWAYDKHYYPMNGTSLMFPGWLQHFAHPHQSDEERIMFSMDIVFHPPG